MSVSGRSEQPTDARDAVCRALAHQAERFPDLALLRPAVDGLDDRDTALALRIYDQAVRRWLTLECVLNTQLRQPLRTADPRVQGALLTGAAQLLLLDRVPARAAIDTAVAWTRRHVRPKPAGLVNAVLRRVAELRTGGDARRCAGSWDDARDAIPLADGRALRLNEPVLPREASRRLAMATSTPRALLLRWRGHLDAGQIRDLALGSVADPPTIINATFASPPLPAGLSPHSCAGFHVVTERGVPITRVLAGRSDVWVQDPASAAPVALIADLQPGLIVDLCAGRGTKTRQLAATFPAARIIATDIDGARRADLEQLWAGHDRVTVVEPNAIDGLAGSADLVLTDVPCSNTGVLRRRVEARYRATPEQLDRLVAIQRQIVTRACGLLAPGGRILYATCSVEHAENEAMGLWAGEQLGLEVVAHERTMPRGQAGDPPETFSDGSYAVVLASACAA